MSKIITLAIAGGAYVLGARAGKERYQQITDRAARLWHDPRAQKRPAHVEDSTREA